MYLTHVVDFSCYFAASLTDASLMVLQYSAIENVLCISPPTVYHSWKPLPIPLVFIGIGSIKLLFVISLGKKTQQILRNSGSGQKSIQLSSLLIDTAFKQMWKEE